MEEAKQVHKIGSVAQPGRGLLIGTSDNQREQRLENTAGGVGLPISTFPDSCNVGPSIVVQQNHLIVPLTVLRAFVF